MKKVVLLLLMAATAANLHAQEGENIVGVSPFRIWNGMRFKYERVLTERYTVGGTVTGYYAGIYPGLQLAPTARFYFKKNAPEGFYGQAKLVAGFHQQRYEVEVYEGSKWDGNYTVDERKRPFTSFGAGVTVGYQLLWGSRSQWALDLNIGLKLVGTPSTDFPLADNESMTVSENVSWATFGPGSIVDGLVSVGYRF